MSSLSLRLPESLHQKVRELARRRVSHPAPSLAQAPKADSSRMVRPTAPNSPAFHSLIPPKAVAPRPPRPRNVKTGQPILIHPRLTRKPSRGKHPTSPASVCLISSPGVLANSAISLRRADTSPQLALAGSRRMEASVTVAVSCTRTARRGEFLRAGSESFLWDRHPHVLRGSPAPALPCSLR
jgi:hypothetical protein